MGREIKFKTVTVTVDVAGDAKRVSDSLPSGAKTITSLLEIHTPSTNSGAVYWGDENVDSTWIPRSADSTTSYSLGEPRTALGDWFDLRNIYVDAATSGDKVIIQYLEA